MLKGIVKKSSDIHGKNLLRGCGSAGSYNAEALVLFKRTKWQMAFSENPVRV